MSRHAQYSSGRLTRRAVARRQVGGDQHFERLQAFAAVGLRLGLAAQHLDDVVVVQRMAEAVDRGGLRSWRRATCRRPRVRLGEFPVLDLVDRHAADAHRALLAEDRDRAFEVLRVGEHGHVDRAQRAVAPAQRQHAGVLDLDVARQRGGVGLHALDRADQPVEQVDVVARLVHERAAVELPGAAPRGAVVVRLRPGPEHVDVDHVDAAEAALLDGALQQLQRARCGGSA